MQSWEFARVKVFPLFQLSKVVKIWTAFNAMQPISATTRHSILSVKKYSSLLQEDIEHPWGEMDVSTKTTEAATRRLAVCNLDWDRVTATDLFGRKSCDIISLYL